MKCINRLGFQVFFVLVITCTSNLLYSQRSNIKSGSIFLEIAGSGGFGSINYEEKFVDNDIVDFTWRAGLSFTPIDRNNGIGLIFPLMINSQIGRSKHKLEIGIGQGLSITTKGQPFALALATVGYRFEARESNYFYRLTYTPLISYLVDFQVQQWMGISVGYTFKN